MSAAGGPVGHVAGAGGPQDADDPGVDPAWRGWSRERLEREYSPSSRVAAIGPLIDAYRTRSAAASAALAHLRVDHGGDTSSLVFPAGDGVPLVVFLHGGYWQELSAADSTFGAADCVPRGIAWAAVDYTLAPRASLARIVDQCRRAVRDLCTRAAEFGCDPRRVWLAGSSAGAHLAAMAMLDPALPPSGARPAGAVLLSGVYDLRPLVTTYVNDALGLDEPRAWALSPLADAPRRVAPALVAWGEHETASFVAQSRRFAHAAGAATLEAAGRNHFDLVFDLGDVSTPLGAELDRLLAGRVAG